MPLDNFSELSTFLAAISLATERLVVIVKTAFPWLGAKSAAKPGQSEDEADRGRRLIVLGVAYLCALATGWIVADGWTIEFGSQGRSISIFGVALLACGGSAFWAQMVGFASAAKDARQYTTRKLRDEVTPQPQVLVHAPAGGAPTHVPALPVIPAGPR